MHLVKNSKDRKGSRHFWFGDDSTKMPCPLPVFINYPQTRTKTRQSAYYIHLGVLDSTPRLGRSPVVGNADLFQYSCLEKFHGQKSLAGCCPWGYEESDTLARSKQAEGVIEMLNKSGCRTSLVMQ